MTGGRDPATVLPVTSRIVRIADHAATFLFALEAGLVAVAVGLDPVGILVICFVGALGGGLIRDLLIGALPPAAVADWRYAALVLVAAVTVWTLHALLQQVPAPVMVTLDAGGLALAAIAGTEKSIDRGIHPFVAIFLGTASGTGGGVIRDIIVNRVPRVLQTDVYASAACLAAIVIMVGRLRGWPPRATAIAAFLACVGVRLCAFGFGWQLPHLVQGA